MHTERGDPMWGSGLTCGATSSHSASVKSVGYRVGCGQSVCIHLRYHDPRQCAPAGGITYLMASKTLGSILQGNDPVAAETVLLQLMTTLGWIHAHTIGKYHKYQRIRMSLGPEIPFFSTIAEGSLEPEQIATIFHTTAKTLVHDQAAFSEMTRCDCGAQP